MIRERETAALPGPARGASVLIALIVLAPCYQVIRGPRRAVGRRRSSAWTSGAHRRYPDAHWTLRRQPERGARCCSSSAATRHGEARRACAGPTRSTRKKRISLRVRNFESAQLKVNDNDGNPIEIAAVVVWRVVDTAEAVFEVDDYENYVQGADRGGAAQPGDELPLRRARRRSRCRCAATPRRSPST